MPVEYQLQRLKFCTKFIDKLEGEKKYTILNIISNTNHKTNLNHVLVYAQYFKS